MNNVKKSFSIRDLEHFSGIKAHTIRIWEKRYNLLSPERTDTNIRTYSLESLQKLLNISLLYNNGHKISKIAKLPESAIPENVQKIVAKTNAKNQHINAFKVAMVNFDQALFMATYDNLMAQKSFSQIFKEVFIPFLNEIGLLWQTDSIGPAHEHFITSLIKQKILVNTQVVKASTHKTNEPVFVLFLPENEIHELGLLYINYEIALKGYKAIYLGQTVPTDTLKDVLNYFDAICFVSYFTVSPTKEKMVKYIADFTEMIKNRNNVELWVLGQQVQYLDPLKMPAYIKTFNAIDKIIDHL